MYVSVKNHPQRKGTDLKELQLLDRVTVVEVFEAPEAFSVCFETESVLTPDLGGHAVVSV